MNNDLQKAIEQLQELDLPHFFEEFKQIKEIVESLKNQPVLNNTKIHSEISDFHKKITAAVASEKVFKAMAPFGGSSIQTAIAAASLQIDQYSKTFKYLTEKLKKY
ncbi:hypothetical protein AAHN97_06335 [Chitinophaga niabensis]|uniref:hypothetical protein n=1 Tax=Chitinophaga niabensis TaxID=536979 RepID=UPI0031BB7718